jgi:hypothetical protein
MAGMSHAMGRQMTADKAANVALLKRVAHLRRAFVKGIGRKPTTLEAAAVQRAANLTAIAEFALANPSISLTDLVRLDHSAERARAAMATTLAKARNTVPLLEELGVAI